MKIWLKVWRLEIIRHHDIPYEFPNAVKKQVKNLTEEVSQEAKRNRVDLRNLAFSYY